MTNTQDEMQVKPTATEVKRIRESLILGALISFAQDYSNTQTIKSNTNVIDRLSEFIEKQDDELLDSILIETLKRQVKKVDKLL